MSRPVSWCWGLALGCVLPGPVAMAEPSSAVAAASAPAADADRLAPLRRAEPDREKVAPLVEKPLYKFTEGEVDLYLRYLQASEPDLRKRIVHLARKNIGQPYELFLLGEMPFEPYDPQPLYCLAKSDCVVFAEHTYAMALTGDWPGFMAMLQRIRYRDGQIGVATRNHYTEADWNVSNRWLVRDVTAELAGDTAKEYQQRVDRAGFLQQRYGLTVDVPVEEHRDVYLPYAEITRLRDALQDGDLVNVVRSVPKASGEAGEVTFQGTAAVGHVGLVTLGADGTVNIIHASEPAVREEPLVDYISRQNENRREREKAGKPVLLGFKFLRLQADPLARLRELDGNDAPRVTLPRGGAAKF